MFPNTVVSSPVCFVVLCGDGADGRFAVTPLCEPFAKRVSDRVEHIEQPCGNRAETPAKKSTTVHPKVVYQMPKSTPVYVTPNAVRKQRNGSGPDSGKGTTTGPSAPTMSGGGNYRRDFAQGILPHSVASSDSEVSAPNTRPGSRTKHRSRYCITDTTGLITAIPVYPIRGRLLSRRFRRKRTGVLMGGKQNVFEKFHRKSRVRFRAPSRRERPRGPRIARCHLLCVYVHECFVRLLFRFPSIFRHPSGRLIHRVTAFLLSISTATSISSARCNPLVDPFAMQQFTCFAPFVMISSRVFVKQTVNVATHVRHVRIFARSVSVERRGSTDATAPSFVRHIITRSRCSGSKNVCRWPGFGF